MAAILPTNWQKRFSRALEDARRAEHEVRLSTRQKTVPNTTEVEALRCALRALIQAVEEVAGLSELEAN